MNFKKEFVKFIKFNLVGILNTAVDFVVFNVLNGLLGLYYLPAKIISYTCGIANSYVCNSLWTFKEERSKTLKELLGFIAVNLVSLGVSLGVMWLAKNRFGITSDFWANCIATPVALIVNFVGNRLFVFKSKPEQKIQ